MSRAFDVMRIWVELPLYVTAGLHWANAEPDKHSVDSQTGNLHSTGRRN
jgi:hypothetical protein